MGRATILEAAAVLLAVGLSLFAKGGMVRITIRGEHLANPIEIATPEALAQFSAGAGPGNFVIVNGSRIPSYKPQSFIVDWSRPIAGPPQGVEVFEIAFSMAAGRTYMVRYAVDPSTNQGYVYIPGKADPEYGENTSMIARGVEGNWFLAWKEWERLANPLIEAGKRMP
jgi:hypothetical protein